MLACVMDPKQIVHADPEILGDARTVQEEGWGSFRNGDRIDLTRADRTLFFKIAYAWLL